MSGGGIGYIAGAGGYVGGSIVSNYDASVPDPDLRRQFNYELDAGYGTHGSSAAGALFGIIGIGRSIQCIDRVPGLCDTWCPGANPGQADVRTPLLNKRFFGRIAAVKLAEGNHPHRILQGRDFLRTYRMSHDGRTGETVLEWDALDPPDS